jgi:lipoprotein-anchoring transpeptidase ErfK/SrfK
LPDGGPEAAGLSADGGTPDKPWWQRENAKDTLHEVTLDQLSEDSDDVLAKRLVTGFYIAVDKTFSWNGRAWYKSTKGLIGPADRFWLTAGSKFKGVELDGTRMKLPVAWVYGGRKTAPSYTIDDAKKVKPAKAVERFTALALSGKEMEVDGIRYSQLAEGAWVKNIHVRITRPGPPPADLSPHERWIDVNLKEQTLVAFEGNRALYATLVSTGKQSTIQDKDHRTPVGQWRIREKHVTTTMDGNGTAAGDLPYSIEDVPYVMYFNNSYAVHGAFWHQNFGVQMSHGCVNLSPLDAKHLFFFTDPPLPQGFHGAWSSKERPGSRIVVHE